MANDADDLERYRRDKMTPAERHAFEKRALEEPFLRDALSGAETVSPESFTKDIGDLNRQLAQPGTRWFTPIRIAAGIVLVATVGWLVYQTGWVAPEPLAALKKDSTAVTDSTSKLLTLATPQKDSVAAPDKKDPVKSIAAVKPSEPSQTLAQPAPSSTAGQAASGAVAKVEPTKTEPEKTEQAMSELAKTEPAKTESARDDKVAAKTELAEVQRADKSVKKEAAPAAVEHRAAVSSAKTADFDFRTDSINLKEDWPPAKKSDVKVFTERDYPGDVIYAAPVSGVSFTRYLEENQRIPEEARLARIRGRVVATFDLSATGSLSGLRIMKSLGYGCDEEMLRLINTGPAWSPTKHKGKPLPSAVVVTLEFVADR